MSKPILKHLTESGIPGIGPVPYGLHLCSFYLNKQELVDSLVPFFKAALENQERGIWITAPPLSADEALLEMRKAVPNVDQAIVAGTLRILDAEDWYKGVSGGDVLQRWLDEEKKALEAGFQGLRITGNTSFVKHDTWDEFMRYEQSVNKGILNTRIVALCSYNLRQSGPLDVFEVTRHHQHCLHRDANKWEIVDREYGPMGRGIPG